MVNANDQLKSDVIAAAKAKGYSSDKKVDSKHAREIAKEVGKPQPLVKAILFEAGLYKPASEQELQQLQAQGVEAETAKPEETPVTEPEKVAAEPEPEPEIEIVDDSEGSKADTTGSTFGLSDSDIEEAGDSDESTESGGLLRDENEGESTAQKIRQEIEEEADDTEDPLKTFSEVEAEAEKQAAKERSTLAEAGGSRFSRTVFIVLLVAAIAALIITAIVMTRGGS